MAAIEVIRSVFGTQPPQVSAHVTTPTRRWSSIHNHISPAEGPAQKAGRQ
jgi:hypothetical protein